MYWYCKCAKCSFQCIDFLIIYYYKYIYFCVRLGVWPKSNVLAIKWHYDWHKNEAVYILIHSYQIGMNSGLWNDISHWSGYFNCWWVVWLCVCVKMCDLLEMWSLNLKEKTTLSWRSDWRTFFVNHFLRWNQCKVCFTSAMYTDGCMYNDWKPLLDCEGFQKHTIII